MRVSEEAPGVSMIVANVKDRMEDNSGSSVL